MSPTSPSVIFGKVFYRMVNANECDLRGTTGGGQNLERRNVERPIFRNFKIMNNKITNDELFDNFILEFIFLLYTNYLHNLIIFQMVKLIIFKFSNL